MHEMSIAAQLVQTLTELSQSYPDKQIREVVVEVGQLMAVVPDSLQFCYQAITEGTALESSRLSIREISIVVKCAQCEKEFSVENFLFVCPGCQGKQLEEIHGRELTIKTIEVV